MAKKASTTDILITRVLNALKHEGHPSEMAKDAYFQYLQGYVILIQCLHHDGGLSKGFRPAVMPLFKLFA